jgi:hypothetical protein
VRVISVSLEAVTIHAHAVCTGPGAPVAGTRLYAQFLNPHLTFPQAFTERCRWDRASGGSGSLPRPERAPSTC